jgi:hypothetical protein
MGVGFCSICMMVIMPTDLYTVDDAGVPQAHNSCFPAGTFFLNK